MPRFKVGLSRTYSVTVEAANREDAKQAADLFVGERVSLYQRPSKRI